MQLDKFTFFQYRFKFGFEKITYIVWKNILIGPSGIWNNTLLIIKQVL